MKNHGVDSLFTYMSINVLIKKHYDSELFQERVKSVVLRFQSFKRRRSREEEGRAEERNNLERFLPFISMHCRWKVPM